MHLKKNKGPNYLGLNKNASKDSPHNLYYKKTTSLNKDILSDAAPRPHIFICPIEQKSEDVFNCVTSVLLLCVIFTPPHILWGELPAAAIMDKYEITWNCEDNADIVSVQRLAVNWMEIVCSDSYAAAYMANTNTTCRKVYVSKM